MSIECVERGQLLAELRTRYSSLLNKVPRQIKSIHEEVLAQRALDRRLTEELMRFKSTIGVLTGYVLRYIHSSSHCIQTNCKLKIFSEMQWIDNY